MDKIAVLIPCYNEGQTIGKVVADFRNALPDAVIYVYDNNSTDETAKIAAEAGAVVRHEYKQGKGNVIRRMFREIDAECYIMVDGDDTYPADAAPEMVGHIFEKNSDMVVGDRLSSTYFTENKRRFHGVGNRVVRWLVDRIFHSSVKDIMTGYRAFSYRFVKSFPVLSKGFEIETEMTIHACDKSLQIDNCVIDYRDRPEGSVSKLNTVSDGIRVLRTILGLCRTYRPMLFFGLFALLFFVLSAAFFIPVFIEYLQTGYVFRFPTLFVACTGFIAAILFFFSGLLLNTLRRRDKQDFEWFSILIQFEFKRKKDENR